MGKKGGKKHQETVDKQETKLREEGYDNVEREVMVRTPEGEKSKRFADLKGTNTNTGETKWIQVGKQNKNGTPVSRERRALTDIEKANKNMPIFIPYND